MLVSVYFNLQLTVQFTSEIVDQIVKLNRLIEKDRMSGIFQLDCYKMRNNVQMLMSFRPQTGSVIRAVNQQSWNLNIEFKLGRTHKNRFLLLVRLLVEPSFYS